MTGGTSVIERTPKLSVGLAVRNGRDCVERCIDSILTQDFTDFELVVCDNVSDDGTIEILKRYAHADRRIKVSLNEVNIGSHENMKLVLMRSRGELFRWISADDWLEPACLSTCVAALDANPEAIGVTTGFTLHASDGTVRYEDFPGEFPDSDDPSIRFARMLWFFHAGDAKYDPVYGVYRRESLLRCRPLRPSERTDWLLSAELALGGPILHLPERLAHRTQDHKRGIDRGAFRRRLDARRGEQIRTTARRLYRQMQALAICADLTEEQMRRCQRALERFLVKETIRTNHLVLSDLKHWWRSRFG
jgi:glycosyltransferase involved in cell wall biosynthesis